MLRNPHNLVLSAITRFGAMAVLGLLVGGLVGCGGSGGAAAAQPLDPSKVVGAWIGPANGSTGYLLVQPLNGTGYYLSLLGSSSMSQAAFTMNLTGSTVTGTGLFYSQSPSSGPTTLQLGLGGSATANPNTLNIGFGAIGSTPATGAETFTPDPAANTLVTLADLAGKYQAPAAATSFNKVLTLTIDPPATGSNSATFTGALDPSGANSAGTGSVSATSTNNQFTVSMIVPSASGPAIAYAGAVYLRSVTPATLTLITNNNPNPPPTQALQASAILTAQ